MEFRGNVSFQENFTCGKWNLTDDQANFEKEHGWWVQGLASIIMGCLGFVVNIIMIIILSTREFRKIFFNKLIITLTISDLLYLSFNVYESLHLYFIETSYCGLPGYIQFISYPLRKITMCFSIYMTVILTFERYLAVTNPITHRNRSIGSSWRKQFLKYISPVCLVSFVIFGTPLFFAFKMKEYTFREDSKTNITTHNDENQDDLKVLSTHCMSVWLRTDRWYILLYNNLTNFVITGAIPFILLVCFNCQIYRTIKDSIRTRQQLNIRKSTRNVDHLRRPSEVEAQDKGIDILQSLVLFGIVISFFVCHVLRVVLNLEEIIYFEELGRLKLMKVKCTWVQFWTLIAGDLSHFLLQVNSSINFFIYGFLSSQFKKALKEKIFNFNKLKRFFFNEHRQPNEDLPNGNSIPLTEIIVD